MDWRNPARTTWVSGGGAFWVLLIDFGDLDCLFPLLLFLLGAAPERDLVAPRPSKLDRDLSEASLPALEASSEVFSFFKKLSMAPWRTSCILSFALNSSGLLAVIHR